MDDFDNGPEFYVMECVERIDIKRDKSGVLTKLDVFLKDSLNTKNKILNSLKLYLKNLDPNVEEYYL